MKIRIFLTFDHELPLGGLNTSFDNALFIPTQRVMDTADKLGVKVTLFSDILCAYKFKEWDSANFYIPYKNQLQAAIRTGHDVQLHVHPHWLTTGYDGTHFLPSQDFLLSDFKNDTVYNGIPGVIRLSVSQLKSICIPVDESYACIAFRAGGYAIYPDTNVIFRALLDQGIRYDSSMAKGYYFSSGLSEVDFRHLPKNTNWFIDLDAPLQAYQQADFQNASGILEIPIATIPKSLFEIPTRFKLKKYAARAVDNRGTMIHTDYKTGWRSRIKQLFSARMLSFDNHTLSLNYLLKIVQYNAHRYKNVSDEILFSVISHPKSMGDYSFQLMEGFITSVQKSFPEAEFTTFSEFHRLEYRHPPAPLPVDRHGFKRGVGD